MSDTRAKSILITVLLGCIVAALYALLFVYAPQFEELARRTRSGEKILFLIPIVIALVFSWAHGAFTGHFWEVMGLRAARPIDKK